MNATGTSRLYGLVCVTGLTLLASGEANAFWWSAAYAAMGQVGADAGATMKDVDAMLAQARQALSDGDLQQADRLIRQAETAGVRYPAVHFGDNPSKARRDLERARVRLTGGAAKATDPFQQPTATRDSIGIGRTAPNPFAEGGATLLPKPEAIPQPPADAPPKEQAAWLLSNARRALAAGDVRAAEDFAARASQLNVPAKEFGEGEDTVSKLALDLHMARMKQDAAVVNAADAQPLNQPQLVDQAVHMPELDSTGVAPASLSGGAEVPWLAQAPTQGRSQAAPAPMPLNAIGENQTAQNLIEQGEQALRNQDRNRALELFRAAEAQSVELEPAGRQRLEAHLKLLSPVPTAQPIAPPGGGLMNAASDAQQVLARQLTADVGERQKQAQQIRGTEPKRALDMLRETRAQVENSNLAEPYRGQLIRRTEMAIAETEKYILDNRAQIELDEQNAAVLAEIDLEKATKVKVQQRIAEEVDKFNKLVDEHRYPEAEVAARRLYEMAPTEPVAQQVWQTAKFLRREMMNLDVRNRKEEGNFHMLADVDEASIPNAFEGEEMVFGKNWGDIRSRVGFSENRNRMTPREQAIEQQLRTPVQLSYVERPLSEVIDGLSRMTGVNIYLDPRGLSQEGVSSDTPVSINLNGEISLRSALNLVLEPLHLGFTIKDEVLKITSEQLRDGETYVDTYYVGDLVIPIPNFVPSNNIGLQGLINDAHAAMGYGAGSLGAPAPIALANARRKGAPIADVGQVGQDTLAQFSGPQMGGAPSSVPIGGAGPGGLGGGANADFDSLIDLIISTVASETWAENGGGDAEIRSFPTNLSLVISQTQAVHEEIADLLEQLRRLQDLQVTIEVRFIRLNDNFFERIGIDFDMNINDRTINTEDLTPGTAFENRPSATVGITSPTGTDDFPRFTADLDIPFRQSSFDLSTPQFGGFGGPGDAASFGFAILSDIEAYFLINAAQGDRRTNVLNAPKVTLFNGQQAFVADTQQQPFVISVIPVVGDFAAAQQPVIVVLSEGTLMTIQAVVSDDRRFVRLTVVPFFSEIGDVDEFTFEGSTSTSSSSSSTDVGDGDEQSNQESEDLIRTGTTVQLPTFQFVSVTTTVSVPDGGTVLLGGIKRLSEGRNEFGVPLLSKVPYINRLFRNVGIGRETDSLMMMVTPRIIIQEEEEEKLGISSP